MLLSFIVILSLFGKTSLSISYQVQDKSYNDFWNLNLVLTENYKCRCQPYLTEDYVGKNSTIFMEVSAKNSFLSHVYLHRIEMYFRI